MRVQMIMPAGALVLALVGFTGCKKAPMASDVLARVGNHDIRADEFNRALERRQLGNPAPVNAAQLLDEMVRRETLVQTARQNGLEKDSEVEDLIRDVLAAKVKERSLQPKLEAASVSEEEVRQAYTRRQAEFATPERLHVAMLFLSTPDGTPSGSAAARTKLEMAKTRVRTEDRGFGALAVEYSDDQVTRYHGGDLGWIERDRTPPRIDQEAIEAAFHLKSFGEVSGIIAGKRGLYLVKLIERASPSVKPYDAVATAIRADLLRQKRDKIEQDFIASVRQSVPVETHPERIPAHPAASSLQANIPPKLP